MNGQKLIKMALKTKSGGKYKVGKPRSDIRTTDNLSLKKVFRTKKIIRATVGIKHEIFSQIKLSLTIINTLL